MRSAPRHLRCIFRNVAEWSVRPKRSRSAVVVAVKDSSLLILNARALEHRGASDRKLVAKIFRNMASIVATRMRDSGFDQHPRPGDLPHAASFAQGNAKLAFAMRAVARMPGANIGAFGGGLMRNNHLHLFS